jgi:hypothetical protein
MRLSLAMLAAAAALCIPALGAEAQQTQQSFETAPYPMAGMMDSGSGWDQRMGDWYSPHMGWGYPGMRWSGRGMEWGHPHMGWSGQDMGRRQENWRPEGQMGGGMGPMTMLIPMMMAIADTNGDGALSLEEHQVIHSRMFNFFDADKDGKLTLQEVKTALRGGLSIPTQTGTTGQ